MSLPSISIEMCYCFPFLQQPTKLSNWLPLPPVIPVLAIYSLLWVSISLGFINIQHNNKNNPAPKPVHGEEQIQEPHSDQLFHSTRLESRRQDQLNATGNTTRQAKNGALYNPRYARIAIRIPELIWRWVCDRSIYLTFLEKSFDKNGFNCPP